VNAIPSSAAAPDHLARAYLIRAVEERLLRLFAEGKVAGTTHTCIGQELSAIAIADSLDRRHDVIISNHRCHGHYIAWTGDAEGLIAEVMGKRTGVCAGIGGSQHLCGTHFFSNGVQGGIMPVGAGMALAYKLGDLPGIATVCIGDGTLGEGVVYETFNIASKWQLPMLVVLENNLYAQSTSQSETLAGDICARAAAFGWRTYHADTWDYATLAATLREAVGAVRSQRMPALVRVDTYRLAAHSKGDDNRDPAEIAQFAARDPINQMLKQESPGALSRQLDTVRSRVEEAVTRAERETSFQYPSAQVGAAQGAPEWRAVEGEPGTQLDAINRALHRWLEQDTKVLLIGEDIRAPYGGAFKVTRGLSDAFPARVLNTPISEAAIVGVGNGAALSGWRPVVEIMFGDFLALCFDQLVNHAAKFVGMYNGKVGNPLVVRSPMGGGRGYGPTHSQNLEKHFAGVPGLTLLVLHARTRIAPLYESLRELTEPVLIIENKLLYAARGDALLPEHFRLEESGGRFPTTRLVPDRPPDLTVVAFGRMSGLAERAARTLYEQEEINVELILPLCVSPLGMRPIIESVAATGKLLVVEEGAAGFDFASEVIAGACMAARPGKPLHARRIAAKPVPIPSAAELERTVLPSEAQIHAACLELFDA
jgi:2-oxoisovalerate dehydrogenase E1 component